MAAEEQSVQLQVVEAVGKITHYLECPICLEVLTDPYTTRCTHSFCRECIHTFIASTKHAKCPLCKVPITKRSLNRSTCLNDIIESVKELEAAVRKDTGIAKTPPRVMAHTHESSGTPGMIVHSLLHPTPSKSSDLAEMSSKPMDVQASTSASNKQKGNVRRGRGRPPKKNKLSHFSRDLIPKTAEAENSFLSEGAAIPIVTVSVPMCMDQPCSSTSCGGGVASTAKINITPSVTPGDDVASVHCDPTPVKLASENVPPLAKGKAPLLLTAADDETDCPTLSGISELQISTETDATNTLPLMTAPTLPVSPKESTPLLQSLSKKISSASPSLSPSLVITRCTTNSIQSTPKVSNPAPSSPVSVSHLLPTNISDNLSLSCGDTSCPCSSKAGHSVTAVSVSPCVPPQNEVVIDTPVEMPSQPVLLDGVFSSVDETVKANTPSVDRGCPVQHEPSQKVDAAKTGHDQSSSNFDQNVDRLSQKIGQNSQSDSQQNQRDEMYGNSCDDTGQHDDDDDDCKSVDLFDCSAGPTVSSVGHSAVMMADEQSLATGHLEQVAMDEESPLTCSLDHTLSTQEITKLQQQLEEKQNEIAQLDTFIRTKIDKAAPDHPDISASCQSKKTLPFSEEQSVLLTQEQNKVDQPSSQAICSEDPLPQRDIDAATKPNPLRARIVEPESMETNFTSPDLLAPPTASLASELPSSSATPDQLEPNQLSSNADSFRSYTSSQEQLTRHRRSTACKQLELFSTGSTPAEDSNPVQKLSESSTPPLIPSPTALLNTADIFVHAGDIVSRLKMQLDDVLSPMDCEKTTSNGDSNSISQRSAASSQQSRDGVPLKGTPPIDYLADSKVLTTSGLSLADSGETRLLTRCFNWKYSNRLNNDITHVIMYTDDDMVCQRSAKYLQGLLRGLWIVSFSWVQNCISSGITLVEAEYEVQGDNVCSNSMPKKARTTHRSVAETLLRGYSITLVGETRNIGPRGLYNMVYLAGGQSKQLSIKQLVKLKEPLSPHHLCIYDPTGLTANEQRKMSKCVVPLVSMHWMMDSISHLKLLPLDEYYPTD